MKFKKIIPVFLLLVLSIQLLPVKQVVSWLISGNATEEIIHADDSIKKNPGLDELQKNFLAHHNDFSISLIFLSSISIHHHAETLILRYADDIPTPPPNFI